MHNVRKGQIVVSEAGYYARMEGKPKWVKTPQRAHFFQKQSIACGVIRILALYGIRAWLEVSER